MMILINLILFSSTEIPSVKRALKLMFLIMPLAGFAQPEIAQQRKADSLTQMINDRSGLDKFDPLVSMVRLYADKDNTKALVYAEQASVLSHSFGDTLRIVTSSRIIGQLYVRLTKYNEAENILLRTLGIAERHNIESEYAAILHSLANLNLLQAKYDKALELNFKVLPLWEVSNDLERVSGTLRNIALVYYKLGDFERALVYNEKCIDLKLKIKDFRDLESVLVNASLCYNRLGKHSQAEILVDSAMSLCRAGCSDFLIMQATFSKGMIHRDSGQIDKAEVQFLKSYKLAQAIKDIRYQLDNIDQLSQIYLSKKENHQAALYLAKAEKLIGGGEPLNLEIIKIYFRLIQLYSNWNDFKKVAHYQQKYIQLKDSTFNEEMTINLMKAEAEYTERENRVRIESQARVLELKEQIIESQHLLNILIGVVVLVLGAIAMLLIRSNRQKQVTNRLLDQKVIERTRELELNRDALIQANQEMDILISRTSDDIKSYLATINGLCVVGMQDIEDPLSREYMVKIDLTSEALSSNLQKINSLNRN
jgi:tetratricopeptide (TPR) repeat protein